MTIIDGRLLTLDADLADGPVPVRLHLPDTPEDFPELTTFQKGERIVLLSTYYNLAIYFPGPHDCFTANWLEWQRAGAPSIPGLLDGEGRLNYWRDYKNRNRYATLGKVRETLQGYIVGTWNTVPTVIAQLPGDAEPISLDPRSTLQFPTVWRKPVSPAFRNSLSRLQVLLFYHEQRLTIPTALPILWQQELLLAIPELRAWAVAAEADSSRVRAAGRGLIRLFKRHLVTPTTQSWRTTKTSLASLRRHSRTVRSGLAQVISRR